MNDSLPIMIVSVLAGCAVLVYCVSLFRRIRQRGGVAGVLVGADIERTVDNVEAHSPGMTSGEMRVHRFAGAAADRNVGLELVLRTMASYQSMTAGLSRQQARELAVMIRRGLGETVEAPVQSRQVRDGPI